MTEASPELINILALDGDDLQAVAGKRLGQVVALEVLRRVASNGDVVVVNDELDI